MKVAYGIEANEESLLIGSIWRVLSVQEAIK